GAVWLQRLTDHFSKVVWLNPAPESYWGQGGSLGMIREIMQDKMYPLTLQGLDDAMKYLSKYQHPGAPIASEAPFVAECKPARKPDNNNKDHHTGTTFMQFLSGIPSFWLAAALILGFNSGAYAQSLVVGQRLPDFTLPSALADYGQRLSEQRGRPLLLIFPGRCNDCAAALQPLQRLQTG